MSIAKELNGRPDFKAGGVYTARIREIVALGVQPGFAGKTPSGQPSRPTKKINILFEVPDVVITKDDGSERPATIAMSFISVLAGGKKASTLDGILAATGNTINNEFVDLIGAAVSVTTKETNGFMSVASIAGLPASIKKSVPPLSQEGFYFDFNNPSEILLAKLPAFLLKFMKKAINYSGSTLESLVEKLEAQRAENTTDTNEEISGSI